MPGAVFGSNPCRVRHGTQQLVFFRDDLEHSMRRQCLMPPPGALHFSLCAGFCDVQCCVATPQRVGSCGFVFV